MRREAMPILISAVAAAACSLSLGGDLIAPDASLRSIPLPGLDATAGDHGRALLDAAIDEDAPGIPAQIVVDGGRVSSQNPVVWSAKSESALSSLEDSLAGFGSGTGSSGPGSNELNTSPTNVGLRPGGGHAGYDAERVKSTVVPLPSAGLLGLAGLALVGAGPLSRRR